MTNNRDDEYRARLNDFVNTFGVNPTTRRLDVAMDLIIDLRILCDSMYDFVKSANWPGEYRRRLVDLDKRIKAFESK